MSEKWKQKILLIFPFAVLAAGMIFTATFFLHTYRQIAFEHTSALCETILANSPEAEPQLLAALKDYHSLTEQELRGNDYLEKYGYRVDDFCYDFPLDTVLFPILFFLVFENQSEFETVKRNSGGCVCVFCSFLLFKSQRRVNCQSNHRVQHTYSCVCGKR